MTGSGSGMGGGFVVDPAPPDAASSGGGFGGGMTGAGGLGGGMVVDPAPPDGGFGGAGVGGAGGTGGAMPSDGGMGALEIPLDERHAGPRRLRLIDQWFDTSPKATARAVDLPLFDPPRPRLAARVDGEVVVVRLEGLGVPFSTRWEAEGEVEGDGAEVRWRPEGPADRVRVAVRSRGGVAVVSLRAEEAKRAG